LPRLVAGQVETSKPISGWIDPVAMSDNPAARNAGALALTLHLGLDQRHVRHRAGAIASRTTTPGWADPRPGVLARNPGDAGRRDRRGRRQDPQPVCATTHEIIADASCNPGPLRMGSSSAASR
jgi:hypothetical protein